LIRRRYRDPSNLLSVTLRRERVRQTKIRVGIAGHYEVQELPYGKAYKRVPGHALIERDHEQTMGVTTDHTACPACGADHAAIREIAGRHLSNEILHPSHPGYEARLKFKENHTEY
jgi:hypothetical protein